MNISYKGNQYGLCFENDYIDVFCFELGYELEDLRLPFDFKKTDDGELELNPQTKEPIAIVNKDVIKKLSHFVYAFMKAYFINQKENIGLDFPLTTANVFGIVMGFTPEETAKVSTNLIKSLYPNLTDSQINAQKSTTDTIKKKLLGETLKPVRIAK